MNRTMLKVFSGAMWLFAVVSVLLAVSFLFQETAYFESVGLQDPSTSPSQAGWWLGLVITILLSVGMIWCAHLFQKHVLDELPALDDAREAWEECGPLIQQGQSADDILAQLRNRVGKKGRIRAAIDSWGDASPNSDPEYVIEGLAEPCRQQFGFLTTLASILVLIGLVGNFFGLAEAVQQLPKLSVTSVPAPAPDATPTPTVQVDSAEVGGQVREIEVRTGSESRPVEAPAGAASDDPQNTTINAIADGLGVVVVSSVMGIGGMVLLLAFVSGAKSYFGALVTQEIVLMSAEIGSRLRPGGGGGLDEGAQDAIRQLPESVHGFDQAAARVTDTLGQTTDELKQISGSLEEILKHQLTEAKEAYEGYQKSLEHFTEAMVDERGTLRELVSSTSTLCNGLEAVAAQVKRMTEYAQESAKSHLEGQLRYENYLQLITEQAEVRQRDLDEWETRIEERLNREREGFEEAFKRLAADQEQGHRFLTETTSATLRDLVTELSTKVAESLEAVERTLSGRAEEQTEKLTALTEEQRKALEAILTAAMNQGDNQVSVLSEIGEKTGAVTTALESRLLAAGSTLSSTMAEAASGMDKAVAAATSSLETSAQKFLNLYDRIQATQDHSLKELMAYWERHLETQLERTTAGLARELKEVVESMKPVTQALTEARSQHPLQVQAMQEVLAQLRTNQETVARLGNGGSAHGSQLGPEALEELKKTLESVFSGLTVPRAVTAQALPPAAGTCQSCGNVNPAGEPYCVGCGAALPGASAVASPKVSTELRPALPEGLMEALAQQPDKLSAALKQAVAESAGVTSAQLAAQLRETFAEQAAEIRKALETVRGAGEGSLEVVPPDFQTALRQELAPLLEVSRQILEREPVGGAAPEISVRSEVDTSELRETFQQATSALTQAVARLEGCIAQLPERLSAPPATQPRRDLETTPAPVEAPPPADAEVSSPSEPADPPEQPEKETRRWPFSGWFGGRGGKS